MRDMFQTQPSARNSHGARALAFAALAALSVILTGCDGGRELQHGYVVDDRLLEQVKAGSSAEQVLVVLGTPSSTSTVGGDAWYYISQKTNQPLAFMEARIVDQRVIAVYFDKKHKVERLANYGLQDGKVFDFASRTTPTGGADQSFVAGIFSNLMRF